MARLINEHIGLFVASSEHHFAFKQGTTQAAIAAHMDTDEQSLRITENCVFIDAMEDSPAHEVLRGDELVAAFTELLEHLPRKELGQWLVPQRFYAGDALDQLEAELTHLAAERKDHEPLQRVIAAAISLIERAQACDGCFFWALGYDIEEEVLDEAAQAEQDAEDERMIERLDAFIEEMDEAWSSHGWSHTELIGGVLLYLVDASRHAEIHATRAQGLALHETERDDEGLEYRERVLAMARDAAIESIELHKLGEQAALEDLDDLLTDELPDEYQETGAYTHEQAQALHAALSRWEKRSGGEARVVARITNLRRGHDKSIATRAYRTFKKTLSRAIKGGHAFIWMFDYTT